MSGVCLAQYFFKVSLVIIKMEQSQLCVIPFPGQLDACISSEPQMVNCCPSDLLQKSDEEFFWQYVKNPGKQSSQVGMQGSFVFLSSICMCVPCSLHNPNSIHIDEGSNSSKNFFFPSCGGTVEISRLYTKRAKSGRGVNAKLPNSTSNECFLVVI